MAPKKTKAEPAVSRAEFSELAGNVSALVELMTKQAEAKADVVAQDPIRAREIEKASPNKYSENTEWEELARDIIGEAVDHTEVQYVKGGGTLFTVVIKSDKSNATAEYLERHHTDRRSREIGSEGEAGVRVWCNLIRDNLKRPQNVTT